MKLSAVFTVFFTVLAINAPAFATSAEKALAAPVTACANGTDLACVTNLLRTTTEAIQDANWRDQTYRELAKIMTKQNRIDDAIALLGKIHNPDTRAMTIRGIGMTAAGLGKTPAEYKELFATLTFEADKISHPPSHAIALTYIAMAQAFAGEDKGATATAQLMENAALRNKAFAETAEIQAERDDLKAAQASLGYIEDPVFRDKSMREVSKIFAARGSYNSALAIATKIDNGYQRAQALLQILARQLTPEDVAVE